MRADAAIDAANENPGALAGATGAEQSSKAGKLLIESYPERDLNAIALADRHRRALALIGFCLVLDDPDRWALSAVALGVRLRPHELVGLAFTALRALDPETREATAAAALAGDGAGYPLPPFLSSMSDARWWTGLASRKELKAYALAAFEAMPPADRSAFLAHVTEARAA